MGSTLGGVSVRRVLLASPRGYCAGVERAVETVERALEHYGAPVYVRKQIVHNLHVVRDLEARGAIFVDDERDAPRGATDRPYPACGHARAAIALVSPPRIGGMFSGRRWGRRFFTLIENTGFCDG